MLWGPSSSSGNKIATKHDYYLSEWNSKEQQKGSHLATLNFADNSRSERGRRFMADHDSSANNKPSLEPTPATNTTFNP
ncbi:hypothetical protein K1719_004001 [Acacia pycnantha]|nr:hypothetical protein K1719_004001 [Acacia pycnantha]